MTEPSETITALLPSLSTLKESGADRFDPVRFHYIDTMARRAATQQASVAHILENKALDALNGYQADFAQAQGEAETTVASVCSQFPHASETCHKLFNEGDFKAIGRLADRLQRERNTVGPGALTRLINQDSTRVINDSTGVNDSLMGTSFDDLLRRQEKDIVNSFNQAVNATPPLPEQTSIPSENLPRSGMRELKSARRFRESRARHGTDRLVTQAITACPQDSGPLNPQRLVISSIAAMRELSPQYLSRLVTHMNALLWLEQASEKIAPAPAPTHKTNKTNKAKTRSKGKG